MEIDRTIRTTFTNISTLYDKARISYPQKLISDIIDFVKLKKEDWVLDVGCGTGQATILFAQRGFNVIGLDSGEAMIKFSQQKFSKFNNISFKQGNFEEAEFSPKFNLIISAMAWHWIDPERREKKAYDLLGGNGCLALFWNYQRKNESTFVQGVGKILDNYDGIDRGPAGSIVKQFADSLHTELRGNKLFCQVEFKEYDEEIEFTKEKYLDLVLSYGWVQKLSDEKKTDLIKGLQNLLENYQEPIIVPYKHILLLAKKN